MGVAKVKETEEKREEIKKEPIIHEKKPQQQKKPESKDMREIVRVCGTDLDGSKSLGRALIRMKGIGHDMSKAVCIAAGIDHKRSLGSLNEEELKRVEEVIRGPANFGIPVFFLNRRKDLATGKDMHITGPDWDTSVKFDIQRAIDLKTYKGSRHMFGLPVRGQRTRASFRQGRIVGVVRKAVRIAQEGDKGKEKKEEKKEEKK